MKYGAHAYIWSPTWSDDALALLDRARDLGLQFLELACGDDVHFTPSRTRDRARAVGLDLVLGPGGRWPMDCDLSLPSADDQRKGLEWHKRAIDLAGAIGAVAYGGALYGHPGHVPRSKPSDAEYARIAAHLHALADHAAAQGVRLLLEPMSHFRTHLVNTPEQAMRLIAMADHENLSILLDTYHIITEVRDYAAAARRCAGRLWGLHACESDRGVPGGGLVPWQALAGALREMGFDGYVGMETYNSGIGDFAASRGLYHDPCPDGDAFVRQGLAFLRKLLANR